jgi:hypothetical protein
VSTSPRTTSGEQQTKENDMAQTPREIGAKWRAEGRKFRPGEVIDEWRQQHREELRLAEDRILAANPDSEVARQIRDHRDAGQYTTQG